MGAKGRLGMKLKKKPAEGKPSRQERAERPIKAGWTYTLGEVCRALRIGRDRLHALIDAGAFTPRSEGRQSQMIDGSEVLAYARSRPLAGGK